MATGVSFSGFNGIDFSKIVDAIMQQESQPLIALQKQQTADTNKDAAFVELGGYVSDLQTSAGELTSSDVFANVSASSSDTSVLTISKGVSTPSGHYEIEVSKTAKAQVTASTNGYAATSDVV